MSSPSGFYVYTHRRSDNGQIFYVGKGRRRRAWSRTGRNAYWQRIAAKYEYVVEIVKDGLPEFCAFTLEKITIATLKARGVALSNICTGGEGVSGIVFSDETKEKMRAAKLGKKLSPEHAQKISRSNLGRKHSEESKEKMRGKDVSLETRQKLSIAATGRTWSDEDKQRMSDNRRGKKQSASWHAARVGILAGHKNPRHSPIVYKFYHEVHGFRECTQYDLRTEFNLAHSAISRLASGLANIAFGWRLVKGQ